MKAAFQANDLPVVNYLWFTRKRWQSAADGVAAEIERTLRYPFFVKPANLGSSIGITRANDRAALFNAVEIAAHYDRRLLVEEAFEGGIEVNCSVLGNDDPQPSVCEQPIAWTEILSYEDKYLRGGGKGKGSGSGGEGMASLTRRIPAPISPELTTEIQRLAVEAFKAVDCAGLARVDFLVSRTTGQILLNEINTLPGFTTISMYSKLWEASGVSYPALLDKLIALALERHAAKQDLRTSAI